MKIFKLLIVALVTFICYACSDEMSHQIDGYWQLKQINYPNGRIELVDTVFYGFQKQTVFSFTVLFTADSADIVYGYLYFPEANQVRIKMDEKNLDIFPHDFSVISGWTSTNETFSVNIQGNKMKMVDSQKRVLQFNRF